MPAAEAKCARCVMKADLGEIVRDRRGEERKVNGKRVFGSFRVLQTHL